MAEGVVRGSGFTGRQVTTMVVAVCLAVVLAPIGAVAATGQLVNITDPVNRSQKARVVQGRLNVGDGSGSLTVDGTIRQLAPASLWSNWVQKSGFHTDAFAGPSTRPINVSSLSIHSTVDQTGVSLFAARLPGTATVCSLGNLKILWNVGSIPLGNKVVVPFPVPLQAAPLAGGKVCLYVQSGGAWINANGYIG